MAKRRKICPRQVFDCVGALDWERVRVDPRLLPFLRGIRSQHPLLVCISGGVTPTAVGNIGGVSVFRLYGDGAEYTLAKHDEYRVGPELDASGLNYFVEGPYKPRVNGSHHWPYPLPSEYSAARVFVMQLPDDDPR